MTSQPLADFLLMPLYNMLFAYWINICFGNQQKHFLPIIREFSLMASKIRLLFKQNFQNLLFVAELMVSFCEKVASGSQYSLLMSPKYTSLPFLTSLSNRLQLIFPPFSSFCLTRKLNELQKNCQNTQNTVVKLYRVQIGHEYKEFLEQERKSAKVCFHITHISCLKNPYR